MLVFYSPLHDYIYFIHIEEFFDIYTSIMLF